MRIPDILVLKSSVLICRRSANLRVSVEHLIGKNRNFETLFPFKMSLNFKFYILPSEWFQASSRPHGPPWEKWTEWASADPLLLLLWELGNSYIILYSHDDSKGCQQCWDNDVSGIAAKSKALIMYLILLQIFSLRWLTSTKLAPPLWMNTWVADHVLPMQNMKCLLNHL